MGSWAVFLLNHYPTPTDTVTVVLSLSSLPPPQPLLLVTARPAFHSQASWRVWPLPSVGSRTLSAASWETRHWRWEQSMNQTGDHTALTLCELLVEHLMVMCWSCDKHVTVVMKVMWQPCDDHLTVMWWSCDSHVIVTPITFRCAFQNTPKFNQVKSAGGCIVRKEWIIDCFSKKQKLPASKWVTWLTCDYTFLPRVYLYQSKTLTMWSCAVAAVHWSCSCSASNIVCWSTWAVVSLTFCLEVELDRNVRLTMSYCIM